MKILAFESSAKAASVALVEDGVLLSEQFQNNGKTHSATLMPMAERILQDCGLTPEDIDCVAVAIGPGSFTGVRIGVAAAKGFAWAADKPCCGVSTLQGMAAQMQMMRGVICPVMDARRNQVYNALFESDGKTLTRLCEDRAISLEDLKKDLENTEKPIFWLETAANCAIIPSAGRSRTWFSRRPIWKCSGPPVRLWPGRQWQRQARWCPVRN